MNDATDHKESFAHAGHFVAAAQSHARTPHEEEDFDAALGARYRRLSLLTLDLAEEAGAGAVNCSFAERRNRPGPFDRRLGAMTRAVWAHQVIERMRTAHERRHHAKATIPAPAPTSVTAPYDAAKAAHDILPSAIMPDFNTPDFGAPELNAPDLIPSEPGVTEMTGAGNLYAAPVDEDENLWMAGAFAQDIFVQDGARKQAADDRSDASPNHGPCNNAPDNTKSWVGPGPDPTSDPTSGRASGPTSDNAYPQTLTADAHQHGAAQGGRNRTCHRRKMATIRQPRAP